MGVVDLYQGLCRGTGGGHYCSICLVLYLESETKLLFSLTQQG